MLKPRTQEMTIIGKLIYNMGIHGGCNRGNRQIQVLVLLTGLVLLIFGMKFLLNWNKNPRMNVDVSRYKQPPSAPQLVIVPDAYAAPQKAYCLDGSNPGYLIRKSSTSSVKNWIIHLRIGAWCSSKEDCLGRSKTSLGSIRKEDKHLKLTGMRDSNCKQNPDFCNWNVVEFIYCDGASYAGNVSETVHVNGKPIYLRGAAIFDVLIKHLLDTTKLSQAQQVVLSGSSAGSLAVLIHLDHLKELLPKTVLSIKGISDGGMFLDQIAMNGRRIMKYMLKNAFHLHNIKDTQSLNNCFKEKADISKWECFMPEHIHQYVHLPVLFISSYYDTWYMPVTLGINCAARNQQCQDDEKTAIKKHASAVNTIARDILKKPSNGIYITSCQIHTLLKTNKYFHVKSKGLSPSNAVVMWLNNSDRTVNISEMVSYQSSGKYC